MDRLVAVVHDLGHEVVAADDQPAGHEVGGQLLDPVDRGQVEARHHQVLLLAGRPGQQGGDHGFDERQRLVEVDVARPVLDLHVHQRQAGAGVEDVGQLGDAGRQIRTHRVDDGPAVGQVGVVDDGQGAVGRAADVELHAVGAEGAGRTERRHRVLARQRGTAVPDHE